MQEKSLLSLKVQLSKAIDPNGLPGAEIPSDINKSRSGSTVDHNFDPVRKWINYNLRPLVKIFLERRSATSEVDTVAEDSLEGVDAVSAGIIRASIDVALKERLNQLIVQTYDVEAQSQGESKNSTKRAFDSEKRSVYEDIFALLDLCFIGGAEFNLEDTFLLLQLEYLFEQVTISQANLIFGYLERRVCAICAASVNYKRVSLALLRICNALMRRLSKAKNSQFCGRVMEFLADLFGLNERSGLNLAGHYNKSNETFYEKSYKFSSARITKLYVTLWKLQSYFSNPVGSMQANGVEMGTADFKRLVNLTLEEFETMVLRKFRLSPKKELAIREKNLFFPKYLTMPELFLLQLKDPSFRKQITLQLAIATHFYSTAGKSQLQLPNSFVEWINSDVRSRLLALLGDTQPGGRDLFRKSSAFVLSHEAMWSYWKAQKCPSYLLEPVKLQDGTRVDAWQQVNFPEAVWERYRNKEPLGGFETQRWRQLYAAKTEVGQRLEGKKARIDLASSLDHLSSQWYEDYPLDSDGNLMENFVNPWPNSKQWLALRTIAANKLELLQTNEMDVLMTFFRRFGPKDSRGESISGCQEA